MLNSHITLPGRRLPGKRYARENILEVEKAAEHPLMFAWAIMWLITAAQYTHILETFFPETFIEPVRSSIHRAEYLAGSSSKRLVRSSIHRAENLAGSSSKRRACSASTRTPSPVGS